MKVILGPLPCRSCGSPVTIVRRDVAYWCSSHGRVCSFLGRDHHVVEEGGDTHVCLLTQVNVRSMMAVEETTAGEGPLSQSHTLLSGPGQALHPPVGAALRQGG